MRLDKFLKNSRIIKRRTVAKEACDGGRVYVNGRVAKPGTELEVGDKIYIEFGTGSVTCIVKALIDSAKKDDASSMYEIVNE
ncbi:MAG: RNA-binding S4 domain-containing protein [Firmicutes bacterium]|nr:RNA-binding S4 domain-containing protein [Bacillota bacterium]